MKKMMFIIILVSLMFACSAAEQVFFYPFGIATEASVEEVMNSLEPIFGESKTMQGLDGLWYYEPENIYLYDFLVKDVSVFSQENNGWKFNIKLDGGNQDTLIERSTALYKALRELYGAPITTDPESFRYDLAGTKSIRVIYEEDGELQEFIDKHQYENGWIVCKWPSFTYWFSVFQYQSVDGTKIGFSIELTWEKTNNAAPEKAAP